MHRDGLVAAARRFAVLLGGVGAVIVVGGLVLSLLGAAPPERAVSLGFYGVGSFLVLAGFLIGNRRPYRGKSGSAGPGPHGATPSDVRESINMAVLLTVLGFVLLAVGVIIDSRFKLI